MKFLSQKNISQKYVLLFLVGFFVFSVFYVSWQAQNSWNEQSPNSWEIAFVEPYGENLDFVLTNYQGEGTFSYTIFKDGKEVDQESFRSEFGKERIISVEEDTQGDVEVVYRINVEDSLGNERVIYKRK